MSKTMSCCLLGAAIAFLASAAAIAPAMSQDQSLTAGGHPGGRHGAAHRRPHGAAGKKRQMNISAEHKQKIREMVPAEYQQYLPKSITGGAAGGAGGGAGAPGGVR